jgi:hypothetical protein
MEREQDYVLRSVEERGVRLIRLWFTDVLGSLKSFAISPAELENALEEGMTFDGSSIDGFSRVQEADVLARPDPNSFELLPWADPHAPEARMFCDIFHLDGAPFEGDPRQVLRRNLDRAHERGFTFFVAPEMEFFLFSPTADGRPVPLDQGSYFDLTTADVRKHAQEDHPDPRSDGMVSLVSRGRPSQHGSTAPPDADHGRQRDDVPLSCGSRARKATAMFCVGWRAQARHAHPPQPVRKVT